MSMQSHTSDDNDDNNDATDDGDDDDTDGVLARDVVDGDGDDLDVAGDVVVDHHQEVVRVAVTEIPQYREFTISFQQSGIVTSFIPRDIISLLFDDPAVQPR